MSRNGTLPDDQTLDKIYEQFDEFIVGPTSRSALHLPSTDEQTANIAQAAVCLHQDTDEYTWKDTAVYPPGSKGFCSFCLDQWLDDESYVDECEERRVPLVTR